MRLTGLLSGFLALVLPALSGAADLSCGAAELPCRTAGGTYHLALPEGPVAGVVLHLHGGAATGKGVLGSATGRAALARGYAVLAPQGWHPENRWKRDWSVRARNTSHERDDLAFLREVLADVEATHGLKPEPMLLSGFSRGGSMVWDIACRAPGFAEAYAPLAGAFWDDLPESCAGPVDLFHTHGWTDRVVPLEGRSFGGGRVVQGDVWASLFTLRETNGCAKRQPEQGTAEGAFWWRHWSDCKAGRIDLMLHPGGHLAPEGWMNIALDWFEARQAEKVSQ